MLELTVEVLRRRVPTATAAPTQKQEAMHARNATAAHTQRQDRTTAPLAPAACTQMQERTHALTVRAANPQTVVLRAARAVLVEPTRLVALATAQPAPAALTRACGNSRQGEAA